MPPLKHALLKIRILSAPHLRLRQVALRVLSLDRKHRLHPHLGTLVTLHEAIQIRLQSFQLAFAHPAQHLPDDIFDLVLKEISHLPRVLSDITDGLNAIANVLSTPSFKGLPARYLSRLRAFCLHSRMALRTLDSVKSLLQKGFPVELQPDDEKDQVMRGLLDIVSSPGHEKIHLTVEGSTPSKSPINHIPFYTAFISHVSEKGKHNDVAERLSHALQNQDILTWVIGEDAANRQNSSDLTDVVIETADIGIFVLSPEYLKRNEGMTDLSRFLERSKEVQRNVLRRPVLIPLYCSISHEDIRRANGASWVNELTACDPLELHDDTEETVQGVVRRVVAVWEGLRNRGVKKEKKPT